MDFSAVVILLVFCALQISAEEREKRQAVVFNNDRGQSRPRPGGGMGNRGNGGGNRGNGGGVVFPGQQGPAQQQSQKCTVAGSPGTCTPLSECAFYYQEFGDLDAGSCDIGQGAPGVCCPDSSAAEESTASQTTFVEPRFTVPMRNLNTQELNRACEKGLKVVKALKLTEQQLARQGVFPQRRSLAARLLSFFQPTERARDLSKQALANIESCRALLKQFNLTPLQASYGLQRFRVLDTIIDFTCPAVPKCDPNSPYRTADGSCNNLKTPNQGRSNTAFQRLMRPAYADGIVEPRVSRTGAPLPSARQVRTIVSPDENRPFRTITLLVMQWGQFMDHDLTLTPTFKGEEGKGIMCCENKQVIDASRRHPACLPIDIPRDDTFFSRFGERCMEFVRSMFAPRPRCDFGFAEQLNALTHYIDGNMVYGSDEETARGLRELRGGLLKSQSLRGQEMLPASVTEEDECSDFRNNIRCFRGGDVRVNEQIHLTVMHLIWLRQHNRIARNLQKINRHWNDEKIYQETRRIVAAMIQHITYNEWLPLIVGSRYLRAFGINVRRMGFFRGYDETINAAVSNEFASAAFRFGHSMLQGNLELFVGNSRNPQGTLLLHEQMNSPFILNNPGSLEALSKGLLNQKSQIVDNFFTDSVTNRLFQGANSSNLFGLDLISLNLQRGREHGITGYNDYRELCGLRRARTFNDLTNIPRETVGKLQQAYAHVDDIDLFIGGISEHKLPGALLGHTFACIVGDGFARLRLGDRFTYDLAGQPGSFTEPQLDMIRRISMARVICDNTRVNHIQPLAFRSVSRLNRPLPCASRGIPTVFLEAWRE